MLCKKTFKNQITLPKKIIANFGNVEYFDIQSEENKIILYPVMINTMTDISLSRIREKISSLGLTEKDMESAIKWARKNK
ncbi:MAG: AbrB/MazE/SpoVT family DNA-binding domain-containing protein [Candidatus Firestonebacteria bacterium]|nr:AbrB/MazE/SpoVT family DNA-binding domain-containing protein [Candidatus Firestonebacteria bacterium]